jgi:hypothetical protein
MERGMKPLLPTAIGRRPLRRLSRARAWPAGLLLAGCAALAQQAPPPDEEDVPEVEEPWDFTKGRGHDLTMLDRLVPAGQSHGGLRYPVYSEPKNGKPRVLESQFETKEVTRLDETHLQFENTVVSSFGDERYPDIATRMVSFVEAVYDLRHDLLFSSAPVQILDRRGHVRAGAAVHDAVSGITVFSGGLKVYFNETPPAPAAPSTPEPPPPPSGQ